MAFWRIEKLAKKLFWETRVLMAKLKNLDYTKGSKEATEHFGEGK